MASQSVFSQLDQRVNYERGLLQSQLAQVPQAPVASGIGGPVYAPDAAVGDQMPADVGMHLARLEHAKEMLNPKKSSERSYMAQICGTMSAFAANPALTRTRIATPYSTKYKPHGAPVGAVRMGDPSRVYLLCVKVKKFWNHFPVPLVWVNPEGGVRGRCYGPNDQRGFFGMPPNTTHVYEHGELVLRASTNLFSDVMMLYKDVHEDSISEGIERMADRVLVNQGTVAWQIIESNNAQIYKDTGYNLMGYRIQWPDTGKIQLTIPHEVFASVETCFREKIITQLPDVDFVRMTVGVERLGREPWDSPLGYAYPGSNESADVEVANTRFSCGIELQIVYRIPKLD